MPARIGLVLAGGLASYGVGGGASGLGDGVEALGGAGEVGFSQIAGYDEVVEWGEGDGLDGDADMGVATGDGGRCRLLGRHGVCVFP